MKVVVITIKTDNAAFDGAPGTELARILRALAENIEHEDYPERLSDINGNPVGRVETR